MTTAARIWNNSAAPSPDSHSRLPHFERILGQIATGVFILEPRDALDASTLEITFVNEMGAEFFGRTAGSVSEVLRDASH